MPKPGTPYREWGDASVMEALYAYRIHTPDSMPESLVREAKDRGYDTDNLVDVSVDVTHPGSAIVIGTRLAHRTGWQGHVGREDDGRYRADLTHSDEPDVDAAHRDAVGWAGPFGPDSDEDNETLGYTAAATILAKLHGVTRFRLVITYEYAREGDGLVKFVDLTPLVPFLVRMRHDKGTVTIEQLAADARTAVASVLRAERAPMRSVVFVRHRPTCEYCDQPATRYEKGGQETPLCWTCAKDHYTTATEARFHTGCLGITRFTEVPPEAWA